MEMRGGSRGTRAAIADPGTCEALVDLGNLQPYLKLRLFEYSCIQPPSVMSIACIRL